ncbi:Uncharacterised protein [Vibrio cholerae]|nr:Uncharacterised protein [Vibrio cholerae]
MSHTPNHETDGIISCAMPKAIVNGFEVINIKNHQR